MGALPELDFCAPELVAEKIADYPIDLFALGRVMQYLVSTESFWSAARFTTCVAVVPELEIASADEQ